MEKLFIISNESIFNYEGDFFCDNLDLKSTPEGLSKKFQVKIIGRLSKKIRSHKINIEKIKVYKNIFSYVFGIHLFCLVIQSHGGVTIRPKQRNGTT